MHLPGLSNQKIWTVQILSSRLQLQKAEKSFWGLDRDRDDLAARSRLNWLERELGASLRSQTAILSVYLSKDPPRAVDSILPVRISR